MARTQVNIWQINMSPSKLEKHNQFTINLDFMWYDLK